MRLCQPFFTVADVWILDVVVESYYSGLDL